MDEFGEYHSFYIWPADHEEGQPFPDDFRVQVRNALKAAGLECESV